LSRQRKRQVGGEEETEGTRNGKIRIKEAVALGAKVMATACLFCLLTLEDAVKTSNLTDQISVKDIEELVTEAIEWCNKFQSPNNNQ